MAVHVLDDYYLAITLLITIAYQLIGFSIAFTLKFDKLTDFAGGTNFILLSILTLSFSSTSHPYHRPDARQVVTSVFLMLWAFRLSGFLLFRILKTGSDARFDGMRDKFLPFLGFWVFQMFWVWTVSLPVTILNSPALSLRSLPPFGTASDIAGLLLFALGFPLEALADIQKYRFRSNPSTNKNQTCTIGLFSWSRHPNYFGEILVQFAIFTICISPSANGYIPRGSGAYAAQYATILGPVFLTVLLLFVSGLTLQERPTGKKKFEMDGPEGPVWREWKEWTDRTSILVPMPKGWYGRMPKWVRRTVLAEWPVYVFVPERDADWGKVRERQEGEERGRVGSADGLVE